MAGLNSAAVLAVITPGANAAGAKNSAWIDTMGFSRLAAYLSTGTLGASATVDAKWQIASDATGTNAVDLAGGQLVQILKASGDNKQAVMNLDLNRVTPDRTKRFVRLVVTIGVATSDFAAIILGADPKSLPSSAYNPTSVVQVVSN